MGEDSFLWGYPPKGRAPGDWAPREPPPARPRSGTTTAAGVLGVVLSASWGIFGLYLWVFAIVAWVTPTDGDGLLAGLEELVAVMAAIFGSLVLVCATWSIVAAVNLLRRRSWARWAVMITYSIWTVVAAFAVADALTTGGKNDHGIYWSPPLLVGCVAVVVSAAVRPTKLDVQDASWAGRPYAPPPLYGTDLDGPERFPDDAP